MSYETTTIKEITEHLQWNNSNGLKATLIIGAGVSVSAGIPISSKIMELLEKDFPAICKKCLTKSFPAYMKLLTPMQRKKIIGNLIDKAKLNAAHIYMSTLIKGGYFDRILTTNFDTLLARSLALENVFPGIYDFAASQNFVLGETADLSIFHLHGQKDGFVLLTTEDEVNAHFEKVKNVFDETLTKRTIIVVGYSGKNDPVFKHLAKISSFQNKLYWVGYKDDEPEEHIKEGILTGNKYAYYLKGFDADTFFNSLSNELNTNEPRIISKPFSYLEEALSHISEFELNGKKTDPAKEIKEWMNVSKMIFENDTIDLRKINEKIKKIKQKDIIKMAREAWMNDKFEEEDRLKDLINIKSDKEAKKYFSYLLFQIAFGFNREYDSNKNINDDEQIDILNNAVKKYEQVIELNPLYYEALFNMGLSLSKLGGLKKDNAYYLNSIDFYNKAMKVKSDDYTAYDQKGLILMELAKNNYNNQKEKLLIEAIETLLQAERIKKGSSVYNIACAWSLLENKKNALLYFEQALIHDNEIYELINEDTDLDFIKEEEEFKKLIEKYTTDSIKKES